MGPAEKMYVDRAAHVLNSAARGEAFTFADLSQAVIDLANNAFEKYLSPDQLNQVHSNLSTLIRGLTPTQVSTEKAQKIVEEVLPAKPLVTMEDHRAQEFKRLASRLIETMILSKKKLEDDVPNEVKRHGAFHEEAISRATSQLQQLIKAGENNLSLKEFVRDYCKNIFDKRDPWKEFDKFLIRCSSTLKNGVFDGKYCQFFVISSEAWMNKGDMQPVYGIEHVAYAKVKNLITKETFFCVVTGTNEKVELNKIHYALLDQLIAAVYPGCKPIPVMNDNAQSTYVLNYGSQNAEGDAALKLWENDPIYNALQDPISHCRLNNPVITPNGHTYSRTEIEYFLLGGCNDPTTRSPIQKGQLRPNLLAAKLLKVRMNQFEGLIDKSAESFEDWRNDPILYHFEDRFTKELMKDPVIAPDDETYDRASIVEYLKNNQGIMPDGKTRCDPDQLISNRVAKDILDLRIEQLRKKETACVKPKTNDSVSTIC